LIRSRRLIMLLLSSINMTWAGVEEDRLAEARAKMAEVVGRYQSIVDGADHSLDAVGLRVLGESLWSTATRDVGGGHPDDRSLYWARIAIRKSLVSNNKDLKTSALAQFELASRGFTSIDFPSTDHKRVLITGFDPFHLDEEIGQSNPSGLAALSLDGTKLVTAGGSAWIEAAVMPVRFSDFDAGMIETLFTPLLEQGGLDLVVTISMGRDAFDLERFPGKRRSAQVSDNANVFTGASALNPMIPMLGSEPLDGPEFVEFSLPAAAMTAVAEPWQVRDNRNVTTLEQGAAAPAMLSELDDLTAVSGSGGGYLSNEMSYRTVRLNQKLGSGVAIGHLHTPRVQGFDVRTELAMVEQIRRILIAAVESLR